MIRVAHSPRMTSEGKSAALDRGRAYRFSYPFSYPSVSVAPGGLSGGTMNPFAIWPRGSSMNAPEKRRFLPADGSIEVIHEGDSIILRRVVDAAKFRAAADAVLAQVPKPRKGASVLRELERSRARRLR